MRCSPPVRMNRSGSGMSAMLSFCASAASSPSSGDTPAAVIGRDGEGEAGIAARQRFRIADQALDTLGKARQVADDTETDAVFVQARDFILQRAHEQLHQ